MDLDKANTTPLSTEKPTENAFRALIKTYGSLGRVMQPYFARFGITGAQWGVLRTLHRAEQEGLAGLRMTDLSQRLLISPPTGTGTVDRLVRMALVARDPSHTDLRAKQVSLTSAGRQLLERVLENHSKQIELLLGGLSLDEQRQLHQLLDRLGTHLDALLDGEVAPLVD